MDAFRLRKKFPEVSQDEMMDLITRFKYVYPELPCTMTPEFIASAQ